ncbi:MAG: hypothetical protein FWE88_05525 [Phycisphaerae bacterium]|nr:hypothetical protein [Phycisphaerae bacterium]
MEKPEYDNMEFKLSQLLDGDLPPDEEALLLARLRDDDELAKTYAGYRRLDDMLEDLAVAPELSAVDYDAQRADIMACIEKKALLTYSPRKRVLPWVFGGALSAAAVAMLAIGAFIVFRTATVVPTPPQPTAGSVASVLVPPHMAALGSVESAIEPFADDSEGVSIVQIRISYPSDDEFMLADPNDNPLAHGDIGRTGPSATPLPAGTVLMVLDRPDSFDWYDIY